MPHRLRVTNEWYELIDTDTQLVIAECRVRRRCPDLFALCCCRPNRPSYEFTDVLVYPPYRGNGYCGLMLLNVMLHLCELCDDDEPVFGLAAYRHNVSARRAYRKLFGPPVFVERFSTVYYSTKK